MSILRNFIAKRLGTELPLAVAETVAILWPKSKPIKIRHSKIKNGYEFVYTMPRDLTFEDFIKKEGNFRAATEIGRAHV